ncbi:MAG: flavodoxin domain-containing protein [bacterium]|nr:flavodoxin domain-containing protein [bacterium]
MIIVLYLSKYGNTLQYASWIADALNAELRPFTKFRKSEISNYDTIIFGTGVYIGKMNGLSKALKMFSKKPSIIFACGGNSGVEEEVKKITDHNFTSNSLLLHKFFYLPGGLDFNKVKGIMKFFLSIGKNSLLKKPDKTQEEIEFLNGFINPTNYVDELHIQPIVDYVRSMKYRH